MASSKGHRVIASIIILIGAILLIAAVFIPWYTYEAKTSSSFENGSTTINSYPGLPTQNGTLQCSSSGAGSCPYTQSSYQHADENNTGVVAETGFYLLIVGFILGFVGAILGVASRGNPRRAGPAVTLGVIAMILAIITPVLFTAALPTALSKDIPAKERPSTNGPWSSFMGTNSSTLTTPYGPLTVNLTWGPAIGWYLAFAAFVVLLIGVILLIRNRKDPEPVPVSVPSASTPAPTAPPTS